MHCHQCNFKVLSSKGDRFFVRLPVKLTGCVQIYIKYLRNRNFKKIMCTFAAYLKFNLCIKEQ